MLVIGNINGEYIIPEINLLPLDHVEFLALAQKVMDTNPQKNLRLETMNTLWRILMTDVYDFVQESEKVAKLLEVGFLRRKLVTVSDCLKTQADAVNDDEFKALVESVAGALSKKWKMAPEDESDNEQRKRRSHRSEGKKTVAFGSSEAKNGQIGE